MRNAAGIATSFVALAAVLPAQREARADIADLLPDRTVVLLDGADSGAFATAARALFEDVVQRLEPPYRGFARLLGPAMKLGLGVTLRDLADDALPGEWAFAIVLDDGRPEPLLVIRPDDGEVVMPRLTGAVAAVADAGVLAITRSTRHGERYHAWRRSGARSLGDRQDFRAGRPERSDARIARIWVDVAALRGDRARAMALEPLAALFARPIVEAIEGATRFDGLLDYAARELSVRGRLDGTAMQGFGRRLLAGGAAGYVVPPAPPEAFACLRLDRSAMSFWRELDGLADAAARVQVQGFLSIADQILNASFVEDLLPAFGEPLTLLAIRPPVDAGSEAAVLSLPAFALVAELRDPDVEQIVARALSALVMITKAERAPRGEITFELRRRRGSSGESIYVAEPRDWFGAGPLPFAARFSFTFAFRGDRVVFASTEAGAHAVLAEWRREQAGPGPRRFGDALELDLGRVAEYLRANRDVLTLNGVLDEGKAWRAKQREVEFVVSMLAALRDARIAWLPAERDTEIELVIEVSDA